MCANKAATMEIRMTNGVQPKFVPSAIQPTDEQKEIQIARGRIIIIKANAGAAKTTTLCLIIGEALAQKLPPESILALTFTEEARDVLRQRLLELGVVRELACRVHILTVDEFCQHFLAKLSDHPARLLRSSEQLRPHALEAIWKVSEKYADRFDTLEISTHNIAIEQFLKIQLSVKATMALERDTEGLPPTELAEAAGIPLTHLLWIREYERIRLGSFDEAKFRGPLDATYDLARHLLTGTITAGDLPRYRTILCDELHDMNESSFTVLLGLIQAGDSRFIGAGDNDQVIHGEMGADAGFMRHRFDAHFPNRVQRPKLTPSRRFGPLLAMAMEKFKGKPVTSLRGFKTNIVKKHYPAGDWAGCANQAVCAVREGIDEQGVRSSNAILIRDFHQSIPIETALIEAGLAYRCVGMQSFAERDEILFLRGAMAIGLRNFDAVGSVDFRKTLIGALISLGEIDLSNASTRDGGHYSSGQRALKNAIDEISVQPSLIDAFYATRIQSGESEAQSGLTTAIEYLRNLPPDTPAGDALRKIVELTALRSNIKRLYVSRVEATIVGRSVDMFIELADRSKRSLEEFSASINTMESASRKRRGKPGEVILERVVSSKGKEYDHVILPFLEAEEFPSVTAERKDEENLFYVAATRARNQLTLCIPDDSGKQSDFVRRMALSSIAPKAGVAVEKNLDCATPTGVTDLDVPFAAKEQAKALGARWDPVRRTWYVAAGVDLEPFRIWQKTTARATR